MNTDLSQLDTPALRAEWQRLFDSLEEEMTYSENDTLTRLHTRSI